MALRRAAGAASGRGELSPGARGGPDGRPGRRADLDELSRGAASMALRRAAEAASGQLQPAAGAASGRGELSAGAWGGRRRRAARRGSFPRPRSREEDDALVG